MAKKNDAPEKRGGILGFFDSIKEFFQKLFEKISVALEFNKRVEEGKKYWDSSPEGQSQKHVQEVEREFGFRSMEERIHDQQEFPGLHEMKMQDSGLLRIPAKVDLLWENPSPEAAAQRYLACISTKFPERPSPTDTHNGQAFAEIANDMRMAQQRGDTSLHQFVVGNTHIVSQVQDGKINISISDGTTTKMFVGKEANEVADLLASGYTSLTKPHEATFFIDPKNNTKTVCVPTEHGVDTYTAHTITAWQGVEDNRSKYTVQNAIEISSSGKIDPKVAESMVGPMAGTSVSESEFKSIVARAYNQAAASQTQSSLFVVGDKMLWVSMNEGKATVNIVPHHCPYKGVAPVTVPVTEKMFREDDGKLKVGSLVKATSKGMEILDGRVQAAKSITEQEQELEAAARAAEAAKQQAEKAKANPNALNEFHKEIIAFANLPKHPTMDDMPALAQQCQDMYGQAQINGRPADVVVCKTPEGPDAQTLVMQGYTRLNEKGENVIDTQINLGGRVLYKPEAVRGEDGTITIEHKGMFDDPKKAFAYVAEQTKGQTWTRDRLELSASALAQLPKEVQAQLPQEHQDAIAEYEAEQAGVGKDDIDTRDDAVLE